MARRSIGKNSTAKQPTTQPDHVVAIGASAGGLEAVQHLAHQLVLPSHFAYVVAQHLAPEHPSQMVALIARVTSLKVVTGVDGAALEAGVIMIAPPNRDITLVDGHLRVSDPPTRFGPSPCIDLLFESLAEQWGEKAIAVVLSGTGSDGARGLRAVWAAGGLTIAQSPKEAKFDGMPTAAISLGGADLVLEAAVIGDRLMELIRAGGPWVGGPLPEPELILQNTLLARLKQVSGIDFAKYKDSTLRRQVQRRMAICGISGLNDYIPLLSAEGGEARALVQNLLVSVTAFFRDPKAFEALRELLHRQLADMAPSIRLRVWVAGCASGEEVYSMAMVISEVLGHPTELAYQLKIFATDLDEQSLAIARRGLYPLSAAASIPDDLRSRFLSEQKDEIEVCKAIRNCIVFARHNLCEDPPFPNLDLISCRNTLIYFTPEVQERLLDLFAFALRPGGLLFLGSSETMASRTPGFAVANAAQRLYRRTRETSRRPPTALPPSLAGSLASGMVDRLTPQRTSIPEQHVVLLEALVRQLCPPALLLDQNHELVEVIGDVSPYCQLPEGRLTASAAAFLRPELQAEARVLFLLVRAERSGARSRPLQLEGVATPIRLVASPLPVGDRTLTLLCFQPVAEASGTGPAAGEGGGRDAAFGQEIERLEQELLSNQDSLQRSLSELEQSNEELEASAEELQASTEELQASNEELEASNEELQATNEELATTNQQLRSRSDQMEQLNNDLENIQASLSQGMVILDRNLRITRFSPLAVRVFGLVASDVGQPLIGVPTTVPLPELRATLLAVLESGHRRSLEASSEEVSYLVQFMPYQEHDGKRLGVIISLTDVSELVALRRAAEAALSEFTCLTIALEVAVWKKDPSLQKLLYVSERIRAISSWTPSELCQNPSLLEQAIDPADRTLVQAARNVEQGAWSVAYRLLDQNGRRHWVQESARVMQEGGDPVVVGTLTDITDLRALEEQARELAATLEAVLHTNLLAIAGLDADQRLVLANQRFCDLVGYSRQAIQGMPAAAFAPGPQDLGADGGAGDALGAAVQALLAEPDQRQRRRLALRGQDGRLITMTAEIQAVGQQGGPMRVLLIAQEQAPESA
ncbi:MAG: PAS domain S-box protein [Cyanobacteria bacterium]|nr:PAS domain S-box protein [Cyanobacteriota bacterium]